MTVNNTTKQIQRFMSKPYISNGTGIATAKFDHCEIYHVDDKSNFSRRIVEHLEEEIEGNFIPDRTDAHKILSTLAEFAVWHLLLRVTNLFEEYNVQSGQNNQWLASSSPQFIDITGIRKVDGQWKFFAIEIKWSKDCKYRNAIGSNTENGDYGLVGDLRKLYKEQASQTRLASHITSLKTRLRNEFTRMYGRKIARTKIEEIFKGIDVGNNPDTASGIEFWGFFVSDWNLDPYKNPDDFFCDLHDVAKSESWKPDHVRAFMLNIDDGIIVLENLAMGIS